MSSHTGFLVANGELLWSKRLTAEAGRASSLLAADGGANHLARIGLKPDAVIGDLDSITEGVRSWVGEERMVHRPDQDRTDLDKALEYAFSDLELHRLSVLGATGGRLDHAVGNLGLLARHAKGERLVFLGEDQRIVAVEGEASLEAEPGETWSFLTFDPGVCVTLGGVRWPVSNRTLDIAGAPSISNEAVSNRVTVQSAGGAVVVVRCFRVDPRECV